MKDSEILTAARSLLEDKGWCKEFLAIDINGKEVSAHSPFACQFCAIGATAHVVGPNRPIGKTYYNKLLIRVFGDIAKNNDATSTKLEHILMAYDFTILMALDAEEQVNGTD
jgi:hypothetical protein